MLVAPEHSAGIAQQSSHSAKRALKACPELVEGPAGLREATGPTARIYSAPAPADGTQSTASRSGRPPSPPSLTRGTLLSLPLSSVLHQSQPVKTTRYFEEQVLRKRPYIERAWCEAVIASPLRREMQPDGRIRFWGEVQLVGETAPRVLRVVTLEDGETVHNAFFDRNFSQEER